MIHAETLRAGRTTRITVCGRWQDCPGETKETRQGSRLNFGGDLRWWCDAGNRAALGIVCNGPGLPTGPCWNLAAAPGVPGLSG